MLCSILLTRRRNVRLFYTTFLLTIQKESRSEPGPPSSLFVAKPLCDKFVNNFQGMNLSFPEDNELSCRDLAQNGNQIGGFFLLEHFLLVALMVFLDWAGINMVAVYYFTSRRNIW